MIRIKKPLNGKRNWTRKLALRYVALKGKAAKETIGHKNPLNITSKCQIPLSLTNLIAVFPNITSCHFITRLSLMIDKIIPM